MNDRILIEKILRYIDKISRYVSDVEKDEFLNDSKLAEACVLNLMQIGELAGKVDADFQKLYADVPWSKIRGLRNRLVHDYEGVNFELVWDIIEFDLPRLRKQLTLT